MSPASLTAPPETFAIDRSSAATPFWHGTGRRRRSSGTGLICRSGIIVNTIMDFGIASWPMIIGGASQVLCAFIVLTNADYSRDGHRPPMMLQPRSVRCERTVASRIPFCRGLCWRHLDDRPVAGHRGVSQGVDPSRDRRMSLLLRAAAAPPAPARATARLTGQRLTFP
jgi:hypothetical protein